MRRVTFGALPPPPPTNNSNDLTVNKMEPVVDRKVVCGRVICFGGVKHGQVPTEERGSRE